MRLGSTVLVLLCLSCTLPPLQGQNPKDAAKSQSASRHTSSEPAPANQTVIVQTNQTAKSGEEYKHSEKEETRKRPHDWIDWLNAFSTTVVAAFTAGMFWMIRVQVREYRKRERAWVTFSLATRSLREKTEAGTRTPSYTVVGFVTNVGSTPATIIRKSHFKSSEDEGKGLEPIPPYLKSTESQTEYQLVPGAREPAVVTINGYEVLNIERLDIHILGQIVYKDIFGETHETRYCLRYYPRATADRLPGFYPEGPAGYLKAT